METLQTAQMRTFILIDYDDTTAPCVQYKRIKLTIKDDRTKEEHSCLLDLGSAAELQNELHHYCEDLCNEIDGTEGVTWQTAYDYDRAVKLAAQIIEREKLAN